jgi:magnesium chelatase subunit I
VLTVFKNRVPPDAVREAVAAFESDVVAHTGEDLASVEIVALLDRVPALRAPVLALTGGDESPALVASAVEFVLEGLHLSKRLNKDASGVRVTYRSRS